jgi:hypothetical protein
VAGQGGAQIAGNALAPYAASLIGQQFDHTDDPNKAAQLLSHAVLGATLAYLNGGNAAAGAAAGAGSEAAAQYLTKELYPEAFDANGKFDRTKLTEAQANHIIGLGAGIGALVGGATGGSVFDGAVGGEIGRNAVENNQQNVIDPLTGRPMRDSLVDSLIDQLLADRSVLARGLDLGDAALDSVKQQIEKNGYTFKDGVDSFAKNHRAALEDAFKKTGLPRNEFQITKWAKDQHGKSFPVEYRHPSGAEVNIDTGHRAGTPAPATPHIGWQTAGKRGAGGAARGHIFVRKVFFNR